MTLSDIPARLRPSNRKRNLFYAAFIVINLILSCYYLDTWLMPNGTARAMPVLTLYDNKSLVIDKYKDYSVDVSVVNNHYFSNKAPLSSYLVFPFYAVCRSLGLKEAKQDSALKKYPVYIDYYSGTRFDETALFPPKSSPFYSVLALGDILCGAIPFVIALMLSLFAIKKLHPKCRLL